MKPSTTQMTSRFAILLSLLALLVFPVAMHAQEARGRITGTVTDANKAAVPGASVKVIDVARGTTVALTTNDDGLFQAPYLLSGTYQVVVETAGLQEVHSGRRARADQRDARPRHPARSRRHAGDRDGHRRPGGPEHLGRLARPDRGQQARRGAAARARRPVPPDGPLDRRRAHRQPAPRPPLRADAHRRLRGGRHARQPQRPADRRRALDRHGERQRGHRLATSRRPTSSRSSRCRPRRSTRSSATPRAA